METNRWQAIISQGVFRAEGELNGFPILDSKASRLADSLTMERGIPGLLLMESAARALADVSQSMLDQKISGPVLVACGRGNNGGDGLALARTLKNRGVEVRVFVFGARESLSPDSSSNLQWLEALGVTPSFINSVDDSEILETFGCLCVSSPLVVDALLGTGSRGEPTGVLATAVKLINQRAGRGVLAVDIPTGLDADTGSLAGVSVLAQTTLCMGACKEGLLSWPARERAGRVLVAEIGIFDSLLESCARARVVAAREVGRVLPCRQRHFHKGDYGRAMIFAGSDSMRGAAVLAASGALCGGAGLVTLLTGSPLVRDAVHASLPEVMSLELGGGPGQVESTLAAARRTNADAIAAGPGLGQEPGLKEEIVLLVEKFQGTLVLDADALNLLCCPEGVKALEKRQYPTILTPHPGEFQRLRMACELTGEPSERPLDRAMELAGVLGLVVLLKGATSVIAAPGRLPAMVDRGCHGMARGGSGDLLTGLIASLAAQGMEPFEAAWAGAWLAGRAGELAAAEYNGRTTLPSQSASFLGRAFDLAETMGGQGTV